MALISHLAQNEDDSGLDTYRGILLKAEILGDAVSGNKPYPKDVHSEAIGVSP